MGHNALHNFLEIDIYILALMCGATLLGRRR